MGVVGLEGLFFEGFRRAHKAKQSLRVFLHEVDEVSPLTVLCLLAYQSHAECVIDLNVAERAETATITAVSERVVPGEQLYGTFLGIGCKPLLLNTLHKIYGLLMIDVLHLEPLPILVKHSL